MKTPLDNSIQTVYIPCKGVAVLLLASLLLAGCEAPSGAPGPGVRPGRSALPRSGTQVSVKVPASKSIGAQPSSELKGVTGKLNAPSPLTVEKPSKMNNVSGLNALGPMTKVEQAGNGNIVELASVIITAKANPFLDWLPKPLLPAEIPGTPNGDVTEAVPVDPFATVNLLGVIYSAQSKVGLVSVDGNQTQFVKKGSFVTLETGSAEVLEVRANGLDLRLLNDGKQKRTFTLPDIVGYSPKSSTGAQTSGNPADTSAEPSGANAKISRSPSSEGSDLPALGQLKKIMEQALPNGSKSSAQGVSVNLQEL